jgi:hypothetical protein
MNMTDLLLVAMDMRAEGASVKVWNDSKLDDAHPKTKTRPPIHPISAGFHAA